MSIDSICWIAMLSEGRWRMTRDQAYTLLGLDEPFSSWRSRLVFGGAVAAHCGRASRGVPFAGRPEPQSTEAVAVQPPFTSGGSSKSALGLTLVGLRELSAGAVITTLSVRGGELNEEPDDGARDGGLAGGGGVSPPGPPPAQADH